MEYCIAAASSPFAPPNCSSSMFPNRGSGVPTLTVYISFLIWWYISLFSWLNAFNWLHRGETKSRNSVGHVGYEKPMQDLRIVQGRSRFFRPDSHELLVRPAIITRAHHEQ